MSNIPKAANGGTDKMHLDEPWTPPTTADGAIDWNNMGAALPPRDPSLGFYRSHEEKRTDDLLASKRVEDMRRMEEARLETAKLKAGVALPPPPTTDPAAIVLEWAMPKNIASLKMEYLADPFLPAKCVVGFFGRGSTAKSSFLATLAAGISDDWSTLWVSAEELNDWITQRHLGAGGAVGTLAVFAHKATKKDAHGRVVASTFDVYRDLEGSIVQAKASCMSHYDPPRPLRLVVLDTALGLTTWAKSESANDDGSVKRLLGYLQPLAEQHDVCIAFIGHSNKGKHEYFADTAAGSSAWTNSPRLSFIHAADRREEFAYVMRVAKSNLSSRFAVAYSTEPILKLHEHAGGHASVLCRVNMEPIVWGEDDSMDLFESATRKPGTEPEGVTRANTLVENVIIALVEMVMTTPPDQHVTREDIERQLGRTVDRPRWTKVENHLHLHPVVEVVRGAHNRALYKRRA